MKSKPTTLSSRQIARYLRKSKGNISIKGRLESWPGVRPGNRWAVPIEFVAEEFKIPETYLIARIDEEQYAKSCERDRRKEDLKRALR